MAFEGLRDWSGHVESLILCPLTTNELAVSAAEVMCRDGGGRTQLAQACLTHPEWCPALKAMLNIETCCGAAVATLSSAPGLLSGARLDVALEAGLFTTLGQPLEDNRSEVRESARQVTISAVEAAIDHVP